MPFPTPPRARSSPTRRRGTCTSRRGSVACACASSRRGVPAIRGRAGGSLRADHYPGTNHEAGRGMDIGAVDGEICRGARSGRCAALVGELAAVTGPTRSTELIYCWDPDLADPGMFARADHCDHIHWGHGRVSPPGQFAASVSACGRLRGGSGGCWAEAGRGVVQRAAGGRSVGVVGEDAREGSGDVPVSAAKVGCGDCGGVRAGGIVGGAGRVGAGVGVECVGVGDDGCAAWGSGAAGVAAATRRGRGRGRAGCGGAGQRGSSRLAG